MAPYHLNEGHFDLPEVGFEDETLHVLVTKLPRGGLGRLTVTTTNLPEGGSLDAAIEDLNRVQASRVKGYAALHAVERTVDGRRAVDVASRWFHEGQSVYYRHVHLAVDRDWTCVGMSGPVTERATCDELMECVLATFRLRGTV